MGKIDEAFYSTYAILLKQGYYMNDVFERAAWGGSLYVETDDDSLKKEKSWCSPKCNGKRIMIVMENKQVVVSPTTEEALDWYVIFGQLILIAQNANGVKTRLVYFAGDCFTLQPNWTYQFGSLDDYAILVQAGR